MILETDHLQQPNANGNTVDYQEPANEYLSINTLFGAWTVCSYNFTLYKWKTSYNCFGKNNFTADS